MTVLAANLSAHRRATRDARAAIDTLAGVARYLDDGEAARALGEAADRLAGDAYALMALGRFNAGKSTLINALLAGHVVPVGDEATTPTLIRIEYAEKAYARIVRDDGDRELTLEQFRAGYALDSHEGTNAARFGGVVACHVGVPAELLRQRLVLYDTPGTAETLDRDETARAALLRCDAALAVYKIGEYGFREVAVERAAREAGIQIFTVVNTFGAPVTEDRRASAWNRLVLPATGIEYQGQSLADAHVHFVDARSGAGLDDLEADLAEFLLTERDEQHVRRYLRLARGTRERLIVTCRARASEHRAAADRAEQDLRSLEQELERVLADQHGVLDGVRTAERETADEIRRDFRRELGLVTAELRQRLPVASLPSWRSGGFIARRANALNRAALSREMAEAAGRYVAERFRVWSEDMAEEVRFRAGEVPGVVPPAGLDRHVALRGLPLIGAVLRWDLSLIPAVYATLAVTIILSMDATVTKGDLAKWYLGEPWDELRERLAEYERHLLRYATAVFEACGGAARERADATIAETRARIEDEARELTVRLDLHRAEVTRLDHLASDLDRAAGALTVAAREATADEAASAA
ncbi:dynamin family protein [Dactylosporangium sp. CA-092794]|uniref:dynamin family protein n=1 Tax=Dactylosporangium sp. CA-092794 TaxID=3239929 RepID=UPI003D92A870